MIWAQNELAYIQRDGLLDSFPKLGQFKHSHSFMGMIVPSAANFKANEGLYKLHVNREKLITHVAIVLTFA